MDPVIEGFFQVGPQEWIRIEVPLVNGNPDYDRRLDRRPITKTENQIKAILSELGELTNKFPVPRTGDPDHPYPCWLAIPFKKKSRKKF